MRIEREFLVVFWQFLMDKAVFFQLKEWVIPRTTAVIVQAQRNETVKQQGRPPEQTEYG